MPETTERTEEYRVVGNRRGHRDVCVSSPQQSLEFAQEDLDLYRNGGVYYDLRIETRTVTTTPWVDLEGGDA